ncbi:PQQ-binding-like beta-propeller repeat protein [Halosolutus halophilus]|uniref:outer membrane protein assembly factor BamB family protein n=1 Tax=Halosolutus halophilus TaxID=1552990 RepID=UPI002234FDAF|nr:PQQ-binding-like beta-propeller repeat protein [Halosolutus halophilus]
MPSTDQSHALTKRQLLALCGSCVGGGALGGYAYGSGFLPDDDCNPAPLDTSPTDWPLPNYDGGNTRTVPSEHAPESGLSEKWSVSVQDPGQPIAINGSVFVAGIRPDFVISYDLFTGEERWTKPITTTQPGLRLSPMAGGDSLVIPQDSEDGDTVSRVWATADGSEQWTSDIPSGHVAPVLDAGLLVFRDSPDLIAIDARTGEECWRERFTDHLRSSTIHAGETIVMDTGRDGEIIALDAGTGDQQWNTDISEYFHPKFDAVRDPLVAGTDRLFFGTFRGMLIALNAATGETEWVTPETHPELPTEGGREHAPLTLEPIVSSDDILVVIESDGTDRSDSLHTIDPTTGNKRWTFEPEEDEDVRIRSAAVGGETVFLPLMDEFHLVDLASGEILETHELDGYAQSVSLADGLCLVATTEGIIAFEEES